MKALAFAAALLICAQGLGAQSRVDLDLAVTPGRTMLLVATVPSGSIRLVTNDEEHVSVGGTTAPESVVRLAPAADGRVVELVVSRSADLVVRLPGWLDVRVDGVRVDIALEAGLQPNDVDLSTVDGAIHITGARGTVRARSFSGDIDVSAAALRVDARSTAGRVRVVGPIDSVDAQTMGGDIVADLTTIASVELRSVSGSIEASFQWGYSESTAVFRAASETGDVSLKVPEAIAADFRLAITGTIEADPGKIEAALAERVRVSPESMVERMGEGMTVMTTSFGTVTVSGPGVLTFVEVPPPKSVSLRGYTRTFSTGGRTQVMLSTRDGSLALTFR